MHKQLKTKGFVFESVEEGPENALRLHLPLITIDSLGLRTCSLLKIDVEGMESQVLRGALATIERCQLIIYFEHASGDTRELAFIFNMLRGRNYRLYWHFANPFNIRNHRVNPTNVFGGTLELNVFSAPADRQAPPDLTEIKAPGDEPHRPSLAAAVSGVAVADYLPDLPYK